MAVRFFIFFLLFVSTIALFMTINNDTNDTVKKDIALITFKESTMYTINNEKVTRVVQSNKAVKYKTKDHIFNGTFILRANSKNNEELTDIVSADFIEKRESKVKFEKNVKYNRDDFISLSTDVLYYDLNTKIAYNDKPFIGKYYNNFLMGKKLYIYLTKSHFKSKKAHFELNIKEKE